MLGEPRWNLPDPVEADEGQDLLGVGGDLDPATLVYGYRTGVFAMHLHPSDVPLAMQSEGPLVGWWSPDPRGVIVPDDVIVTHSLWRSMGHFSVSVDLAFDAVLAGCADPARPHGWITDDYRDAYHVMHEAGFAHSIEVWDDREGVGLDRDLAGGLLCVEVGGLVAAESKFHRVTDASKVAVVVLAGLLRAAGGSRLIDVQWWTEHLGRLGAGEVERDDYLGWIAGLEDVAPALVGFGLEPRPARELWPYDIGTPRD